MGRDVIGSEERFAGRVIRVRVDQLEGGGEVVRREVAEVDDVSCILALRTRGGRQEALLVGQYRHPVRETMWEIPAGRIDRGEDPPDCARRELAEETGYDADEWHYLGAFYSSPGFTTEFIHAYAASGLRRLERPPEGDEMEIRTRWFPLDELCRGGCRGRIRDAKTLAAAALYSSACE